jgi:hypothetical protein
MTNVYGHGSLFLQPDRYAYPSCTKTPHPIVACGYNDHANYVDDKEICESLPLILVDMIWVCGIPRMSKSDARMRKLGPRQVQRRVETYNREYGNRTESDRIKKSRTGAWMRAKSRGRRQVGTWYTMSTTLEYINKRVRMPRSMVDAKNALKTYDHFNKISTRCNWI